MMTERKIRRIFKIKARPMKGMRLLVEETKKLGVFVFEDFYDRRLYAELCKKADLLKGFIWEILTPEQLKNKAIGVEETYNERIYQDMYENPNEPQIKHIEETFND